MPANVATREQFNALDSRFSYHPEFAQNVFINNANAVDYLRGDAMDDNEKLIKKLEKRWAGEQAAIEAQAKAAFAVSREKGLAVLHRFNVEKMDEAQGAVQAQLDRLTPHKIVIMADAIDPKSDQTVKIALLSCDDLDATKINRDKTSAGVSRESIGNGKILSQETAKPVALETADVDGDGKLDMVMSFAQKDLAKNMMAGAVYDTYLYTQEGRERVTAFDTVRIKGQTNKKYSSKERGHDR